MHAQSQQHSKKRESGGVGRLPESNLPSGSAPSGLPEHNNSEVRHEGDNSAKGKDGGCYIVTPPAPVGPTDLHRHYDERYNVQLRQIFNAVVASGAYNCQRARIRVPSGLCIPAWRRYLNHYHDARIVDYLECGWPVNFKAGSPLCATHDNHASARDHESHIDHYVRTELGERALAGPFAGPPVSTIHLSPLMTKPKRDSSHRRVIMDLSWPRGESVNDGVDIDNYIDGPAAVHLPTADYMVDRLLQLGPGAYLYKTDLARGYRQLRVDPGDWPLLGFKHNGAYFMDLCPPFGLRTSAMFMQRTSEAVSHVHANFGFYSRPYLDDFGGAESDKGRADDALNCLQKIMQQLGLREAAHKVCRPAQVMTWLGIRYDSVTMIMSIPPDKLEEIMGVVRAWQGKTRATAKEMQSLIGLLQFVASVSPPPPAFSPIACSPTCVNRPRRDPSPSRSGSNKMYNSSQTYCRTTTGCG